VDDRDLRDEFREEFDHEAPPPDGYHSTLNRAFEREAGSGPARQTGGPPRRAPGRMRRARTWAPPIAAVLVVTIVTAVVLESRSRVAQQPRPAHPARLAVAEGGLKQGLPLAPGVATSPDVHVAARSGREGLMSAGDVIEETEDGGQSWRVLFAGGNGHRGTVRDLEWVTGTIAYAATTYGLLQLSTRPPGFSVVNQRTDVRRIDFVTPLVGYAIAGDRVIRTADGGHTFSDLDVGLTLVNWIQWVTAGRAWAAGPRGVVATIDGGRTWAQQLEFKDPADDPDRGDSQPWTQVGFADALNGFAYHRAGDVNTLLHTSDGGGSWEPAPRLPAGTTSNLVVTGPRSAELVQPSAPGRPSLCATSDAGMSWHCSELPIPGNPGQMVAQGAARWLALLDSGAVFAVSQNGQTWSTLRRPFQGPAPSPSAVGG
jgi:photosystem II stability/assembly factor-like uncharacterized protein